MGFPGFFPGVSTPTWLTEFNPPHRPAGGRLHRLGLGNGCGARFVVSLRKTTGFS